MKRKSYGVYRLWPELPIIKVNKWRISFSDKAYMKMGLTKDSEVLFRKYKNKFFISEVPSNTNVIGNQVLICKRGGRPSTLKDKFGIPVDAYVILDPVFINGVDWYELELFNSNKHGTK